MPRFVLELGASQPGPAGRQLRRVHIVTTLLDGFAPITLLDVVSRSGRLSAAVAGFGALAFDLLIAIVMTSLVRRRLGYGAWRATHWLAYASWPVALMHGLGTGSDAKTHWMLLLPAGCVAVMLAAVAVACQRGLAGAPRDAPVGRRAAALLPLGLVVWLPSGPLAAGWAKGPEPPRRWWRAPTRDPQPQRRAPPAPARALPRVPPPRPHSRHRPPDGSVRPRLAAG